MNDNDARHVRREAISAQRRLIEARRQAALELGRLIVATADANALPPDRADGNEYPKMLAGSFAGGPGYERGKAIMLALMQACMKDRLDFLGTLNGMGAALAEVFRPDPWEEQEQPGLGVAVEQIGLGVEQELTLPSIWKSAGGASVN